LQKPARHSLPLKGGFITMIDGSKVLLSRKNVVYVANSIDSIDGCDHISSKPNIIFTVSYCTTLEEAFIPLME